MYKKPCGSSEIQLLTLIKGMLVLTNYLHFQESLPLSGSTELVHAL